MGQLYLICTLGVFLAMCVTFNGEIILMFSYSGMTGKPGYGDRIVFPTAGTAKRSRVKPTGILKPDDPFWEGNLWTPSKPL